jgi:hypothetical protein
VYVQTLFQYLGASYIREHLIDEQWEQKIYADKKLQIVASWLE